MEFIISSFNVGKISFLKFLLQNFNSLFGCKQLISLNVEVSCIFAFLIVVKFTVA